MKKFRELAEEKRNKMQVRNCVLKCWRENEISGVVMGVVGGGFVREKV